VLGAETKATSALADARSATALQSVLSGAGGKRLRFR